MTGFRKAHWNCKCVFPYVWIFAPEKKGICQIFDNWIDAAADEENVFGGGAYGSRKTAVSHIFADWRGGAMDDKVKLFRPFGILEKGSGCTNCCICRGNCVFRGACIFYWRKAVDEM